MEIADANIIYQLYTDLINSIKDHGREFGLSDTFWFFTFDALYDAVMIRLCRIYDQAKKGINLFNLLKTIRANVLFFEKEHFRERLKDNPFVESLAKDDRIPDKGQLERDILTASDQNPLVKKLILWRNNIIVHRSLKVSLGKNEILADKALTQEEIKILLNECHAIFNRYSILYRASAWSKRCPGHSDYKSLLKFLNLGLQKWDEDRGEFQELKRKQAEQDKP